MVLAEHDAARLAARELLHRWDRPLELGAFTALRFPEEPMNTVYVELSGGAIYLERPADVERYANIFEQLTSLALDEQDTAELLDQINRRI
ncbi:MAG: Scr1 family TA system antitoxin-like transcriptional regulator [Pseudonocardiaceae bacterium]